MPTVLVVDDNNELRSIVTKLLRYNGYAVLEARSGDDAIKILNSGPVDVLIADLYLPGDLNGVDILLHYRKVYPKGCRILSTAVLSDMLRRVCKYIDAMYLEKPFPLDELLRKIESFMPQS